MHVVVVGGGVIGCAAALALARRGVDVELLERGIVGSGASGAAAGMLAPLSESVADGHFVELGMAALHDSDRWIARIEELAGLQVGLLHSGVLMLARAGDQEAELKARLVWQRQYDSRIEFLAAAELYGQMPDLGSGFAGALHYPGEAQVDALRYAHALGQAARAADVNVREGIVVTGILTRDAKVVGVEAAGDEIAADVVLLTTGSESSLLRLAGIDLPLRSIKGEMVRLLPNRRLDGPIIFAPGGYLTPKADGSILVGATQIPDWHDLAVVAGSVKQLLEFAFSIVPALNEARFVETLAGLRPSLPDRLPAVGPAPQLEGLWLAVGHHRNGILLAGWTAEQVTAALLDGQALPDALKRIGSRSRSVRNPAWIRPVRFGHGGLLGCIRRRGGDARAGTVRHCGRNLSTPDSPGGRTAIHSAMASIDIGVRRHGVGPMP